MASHGIRDRVAIVGMGCTPFREHWDSSLDDLLIDAHGLALSSAGMVADDIDAYWYGTSQSSASGISLATPLRLADKPVTRVENYCATGSDALRQACYAVASGAYDVAVAIGAEKVKDGGYQGLNAFPIPTDGTNRTLTAAAMFSLILPAYAERYGVDAEELRYVVAKIAEKNHFNGARNELAQFRRETSAEAICEMPAVAGGLSVFDCAGVADGAAAAVVVAADRATDYTDAPLYVKALSLVAGNGSGLVDPEFDFTTLPECAAAAAEAYAQAGITDPRRELDCAEIYVPFSWFEPMWLEGMRITNINEGWKMTYEGATALDGDFPVNMSGGVLSSNPIGAAGLIRFAESALQVRGPAGRHPGDGAAKALLFGCIGAAVDVGYGQVPSRTPP